ncbi:right-handed parallel beta-helix repeat-containing protein [Sphingosinicella sp. BN140058]|uniref:right-handed parallel beta-helix repeat-containing protein n=1 Tax=Sphingosinicella sp. BN140058 TaxID=1892855 RepID=UPI0013ED1155|nr:right-handed parallel beta-helix repeat-containing protein [Sphingosinicella sp. BN140058]
MFGAVGDGRTNDSTAFAKLATAVSMNGGGIIELRRTTYLLAAQLPNGARSPYHYEPFKLLEFTGCRKPLIIRGNGARLRCAAGLRYGVFDAAGAPAQTQMPYFGPGLATPYRFLVKAENCTGGVEISDLELDGNLPGLLIGGQYGDTGRQIPAIGLALINNDCSEMIRNVHSHHHAQDGFYIDGIDREPIRERLFWECRSEYNARQGCSIVGGSGYLFERCRFNHTGRSTISSAPAAGVDIEAEGGKRNRGFRFLDCEFSNNVGCGMVADTGDSADASFTGCTFIGTTNWAVWPNKPGFRFHRCRLIGASARAFGDNDPARATQFHGCTFIDDPKLTPGGKVYGGTNKDHPLFDLAESVNVLFNRCTFLATRSAVMPWSTNAIYVDCTMSQARKVQSFPRGTWRGRNLLNGAIELGASRIQGQVILNGQPRR